MSDQQQQPPQTVRVRSKWDQPASTQPPTIPAIPTTTNQPTTVATIPTPITSVATTARSSSDLDLNAPPSPTSDENDAHESLDTKRMKLAQEAARKINEHFQLASSLPSSLPSSNNSNNNNNNSTAKNETDQNPLPYMIGPDNTLIKEIEINNARNRYMLTKVSTLNDIERETGAVVTVKGKYYREGEEPPTMTTSTTNNASSSSSSSSSDERPLYLHIAAENEEQLNRATDRIEQIMKQAPSFLTAKVLVGIENPDPGFNIPANIIGKGGINVKHITQTTGGTRVQLKGKGSGYRDHHHHHHHHSSQSMDDENESEPMYIHLSSSNQQNLDKAKRLAESLLNKVRQNYERYLSQKRQPYQQHHSQQSSSSTSPVEPTSSSPISSIADKSPVKIAPPPSIGAPPTSIEPLALSSSPVATTTAVVPPTIAPPPTTAPAVAASAPVVNPYYQQVCYNCHLHHQSSS